MQISGIMLYWQENWQLGMGICTGVVLAGYLTTSILILCKVRKIEGDIACSAFLPIVNLVQLLRYKRKYNNRKRQIVLSKELKSLEDEEVEL